MPDLVRTARPQPSLRIGLAGMLCAVTMVGCASWLGIEPVHENKFVEYYDRMAAGVAQVDPSIQSPDPSPSMGDGRELVAPALEDRWLLSLPEALRLGLENNKIIRQNAQFMSPNNPVLQSPDAVPSVFDSIIQNEGVLFGQRGVNAALSDFDPRLTVTMKSGEDQTAQNTTNLAPPDNILDNNYMQYQSRLEQSLLGGGIIAINQNWNYSLSNQRAPVFNSAYTGVLGAEYRQPLWSGAGKFFTSVAGPANQRARGFSNVSQGVVIAHINKRLSEIDLQENLQNLVREIGDLYWDLYQNYQDYDAEHATTKVAKDLWDSMTSREYQESGVDLAQAEDAYFDAKGREELALSNLYLTEAKLRRLIGLPIDDARMIFPSDQPREEEIHLNRSMCLYEALCNRLELTRQKTNLHSLELQLVAARKLVAPKLDFISGYALNGFGHNFANPNTDNFNSAVSNLYSGKETSWSAGFEYSIPLWLRQERAQVRQLEFRIVKARRALATQENEIAHELNTVLMTIKRSHSISQIYRRRLQAARKRVSAARSAYEGGYKNSDLFLRALTSQTVAQVAYAKSITEFNKSLRDLLYRTGRLLPADGIAVLGVDGLPLMSPSILSHPLEEQTVPPRTDDTNPETPSPTDPKAPQNDQKPKTEPKSNQRPPVALEPEDGFSVSPVSSAGRVFLVDEPVPILQVKSMDVSDDLPMELPLKVREESIDDADELPLSDEILPLPGQP